MKSSTIKIWLAIIGTVILTALVVVGFNSSNTTKNANLGAQVQNDRFYFTSGITASGSNSYINRMVQSGKVTAIAAATNAKTLSADDVCNSTFVNVTPAGATATVTFPTSAQLLTSCLPNIGDVRMLNYMSTATSTVIAAGSGGTLGYSSSATIAAGKYAYLRLLRDTATTYKLFLVNILN